MTAVATPRSPLLQHRRLGLHGQKRGSVLLPPVLKARQALPSPASPGYGLSLTAPAPCTVQQCRASRRGPGPTYATFPNNSSSPGDADGATPDATGSTIETATLPAIWDLDWFHYTPWWYKPHYLIIGGVSFIVGCNLGTTPCLKTTVIAAAPVAVGWFIFLFYLPRQFRDFAVSYIETHPECEKAARLRQTLQRTKAAVVVAAATAQQQQGNPGVVGSSSSSDGAPQGNQ